MGPHPGCAQGQRSRDTDTSLPRLKSLLLPQTWLDHHQTCTRWSPDGPASRVCSRSRSKVMWYGHFCNFTKIASSCKQIAGSWPNLHTMVRRRARIHDVLKVRVKGHVIRALLWCHEMFAIQYGLTFCLYMRSLYETPLYSPSKSSISIRQLSTYWNELLRHWRSGFNLALCQCSTSICQAFDGQTEFLRVFNFLIFSLLKFDVREKCVFYSRYLHRH